MKKFGSFFLKLVISALIVGILAGVLELFIGHRFILDPLLYNTDYGFVYESYFAPTWYGLTKSIVVALTFFFVYLCAKKIKLKPIIKSAIVGILGTIIFGIYYYLTFPTTTSSSSLIIGIVHFSFIFGVSYLFTKLAKKWLK